jgi:hypothetical protein
MQAVVQNRPDPICDQGLSDMEQRWLALAHSYEFAERLSRFVEPLRRKKARHEQKPRSQSLA